jgi:hypothetical protein
MTYYHTRDGGKPPKEELRVSGKIVYHPEHGVLSQGIMDFRTMVFHPVVFRDGVAAQKWIDDGCIAEVQENLGNLAVGFTKTTVVPPKEYV